MKPINIISKLNEAKEVKKPYGDAPQERGKERLERGKKASLPSKKIGGSLAPSKFYKLKKNNAKAADIYANDTDKVLDRVKDKNLGKGITNNKATLTRKAKLKKIVKYGDKPQPAINNKLIKESEEAKEDITECGSKLHESSFDENSDPVEVLTAIYNQYEELGMINEFFNDVLNHTDLSLDDLIKWYEMGEEGECNTPDKSIKEENLDEGMRNSEIKAKLRVVLPTDCTVGDIRRKNNNEASVDILSSGKKVLEVGVNGLYFYLPEHPGVKYNSESDASLDELKVEILTALGR